ncbi:DNA repair protein RadC [Candidatus Roizmanbacteria bacterium]|nr:DNA repair protein RadC [Candidatus Roizmanbacteria bacterium]
MKIKDLPKVERPREKLKRYGLTRLTDAELLAIVLGKGEKGQNVLELSKKILKTLSKNNLDGLKLSDFEKFSGVGEVKASQIIASFELGRRFFHGKEVISLISPQDIWHQLGSIRESRKEHFIGFYLNVRNEVIHKETISIGTLNASLVHPREIFEPALRHLAAQIIICHNHPSGEIQPSQEDRELTQELVKAGQILGIEIIDHIVVTEENYFSFKEKGLL